MAVCNLFSKFTNVSGNFLLFSQYVEDITKNYGESDNWKVVPTKFVALNIDYSKLDMTVVSPNGNDLNSGIPKYFQNVFENGCAWCRGNAETDVLPIKWNPELSRNMFWNCMLNGKFITTEDMGSGKIIPEVVYYGDINMHSYNMHQGMGYGEVYCYIPTDAKRMYCNVEFETEIANREYITPETKLYLEGYKDLGLDNYKQQYYINQDFIMPFDDSKVGNLLNTNDNMYNINTVVVLYSIFHKLNNDWICEYESIPMGMYLTGVISGDTVTNSVTKYPTTSYGAGTSYGLRICSRFSATTANGIVTNNDITVDNSNYTNMCQLMSKMNENLSLMLDVTKSAVDTTQQYKELLSMVKNNRTNVPYVKTVNGTDFWFVNGKMVSSTSGIEAGDCCTELSAEIVSQRIKNIMDNDPTNDYTKIYDGTGCECDEAELAQVVNRINDVTADEDFEFDWTDPNVCVHEPETYSIASRGEVSSKFEKESSDYNSKQIDITDLHSASNPDVAEELNK
jgi:hypothetical protein